MSTRSLNKVLLIGNLTRDPNIRFTQSGTSVCTFSIATNRIFSAPNGGEKQEQVEYHNIVAWGKLSDICGQLLHKGDKVFVEGRLQTRDWKGNDGQDRRTTEIVIDNMMLLNSRGMGGGDRSASAPEEAGLGEDFSAMADAMEAGSEGSDGANTQKTKSSKGGKKGKSSSTQGGDDQASAGDQSGEDELIADGVADDIPF